jgi:hypothetical protein
MSTISEFPAVGSNCSHSVYFAIADSRSGSKTVMREGAF